MTDVAQVERMLWSLEVAIIGAGHVIAVVGVEVGDDRPVGAVHRLR